MSSIDIRAEDLSRVISGDLERMRLLTNQAEIVRVADQLHEAERTLKASAVKKVLTSLLQREISPEQAQSWASFVRWGLIATKERPIKAIDIPVQEECEDIILDAISRLDELGDVIDGTVSDPELRELIKVLDTCT